jgi:hypothetical protein
MTIYSEDEGSLGSLVIKYGKIIMNIPILIATIELTASSKLVKCNELICRKE